MPRKVYAVDVSVHMYVLAEDEQEAENVATASLRYEVESAQAYATEVSTVEAVDPEWRDALPYSEVPADGQGDRTVRELLNR